MIAPAVRREIYTAADVAAKFGRGVDWLYRHRDELVKAKGFPRPWQANPLQWLRAPVDEWFSGEPAEVDAGVVTAWRAKLAHAYGRVE